MCFDYIYGSDNINIFHVYSWNLEEYLCSQNSDFVFQKAVKYSMKLWQLSQYIKAAVQSQKLKYF